MAGVVTRATKGAPINATEHDDNLSAIVTLHKGSTEPSPTYACMLWADTATSLLKQRNVADSAWVTLGSLDSSTAFISIADDGLSGDKIDGGTISNFASTGIDDNATSTAITIDSSNNIGLGTDSPAQELDISATAPTLRLTDTTTSGLYHEVVSYSNDLRISADGGNVHGSTDIEFLIDGTERMKITNAGMVNINDGNLVISTSGHGIDFSATSDGTGSMTSELLDDYEEGTFTPVIADASTGGNTGSAGTIKGFYTKIGRLVNVSLYIVNIDTTGLTSGNDLFFRGFPFTSNSESHHYADGISRIDNVNIASTRNSVSAVMTNNDSWCKISEYGDNVADDFLTVSDYTSGTSDVFINITYMV